MIITSQMELTAKDSILQGSPAQVQQQTRGMAIAATVDDPPPYFPNQVLQSPRRPVPPIPRATSSTLDLRSKPPNTATNFVFIKTRQEPVQGVFRIDPELQTIALDKEGATAIDRRGYNRKHRQRHRHHIRKRFKKRTDLPDPNAIFETRQGAIQLDISVVAPESPLATHSRTLIQATTRQGPVDIKVHGIHPQRRLNMEVKTRKGDILILIPRSFSGYIQLYSRQGQLVFLPSLASAMSLVTRYEREVQVAVGDVVDRLPAIGTEWSGDTMHIASRQGDIFIGYVGEDNKPTAEPGFWKKLTHIFQPSSKD